MNKENTFSAIKNKKNWLFVIVISAIIFCGWFIYSKQNKSEEIILYGNVDIRQVSLAFNANERIDQIYVEEGDIVKKGQLLASLDTENIKLQIEKNKSQIEAQESIVSRLKNGSRPQEKSQMLAKVNAAKAEAQNAKIQLQRIENAYNDSDGRSVSKQEIDNARSNFKVTSARVKETSESYRLAVLGPRKEEITEAEARLKAEKAELAIQEYLLEQAHLKSPIDGVIRSRLQEPGDMASPQQITFLLAVNDKKWVRAYIQEKQLGYINEGMEVSVYIDSYSDKPIKGQIGYISSVAEFTPKTVQTAELRTSLLYEIRVYVKDSEDILRMGMPATIKINSYNTADSKEKNL